MLPRRTIRAAVSHKRGAWRKFCAFIPARAAAAIASSFVSRFNNGTTVQMTMLVGVCGIAAFLTLNLLINVKSDRVPA
jgi:hypothetical protein